MAAYLASFHFMLLRCAVGALVGVLYGLLIGVLIYPLTHIGLDYEHPGPLIPNTVEFAWFATVLAALIAGAAGVVVGLIVALLGPARGKAATVGLVTGLIVIVVLASPNPKSLIPWSVREAVSILVTLAVLPLGLALMAVLVGSLVERLKRFGP